MNQSAEACFYIGARLENEGRLLEAADWFKRCLALGRDRLVETDFAAVRLAAIKAEY